MIRRDFDLEEMKYFLHLVGQSTDDYLYILDLTNDKAVYSKSITNVFALDSEEFSNATQELVKVVHPDDIDMLMNDIQDGMNGRKSSHNLEYRWKTVDGEYVAINCRGQYVISQGLFTLLEEYQRLGNRADLIIIQGFTGKLFLKMYIMNMLKQETHQVLLCLLV